MKYSICRISSVIGSILLSCFFPVVQSTSVAYDRGTRLANKLWNVNNYSCTNIESYRRDAQRNLFRQCEDEFDINAKFVQDCQNGVDDTIKEKEGPCVFDTEDCKKYGRSVGFGVAARVCSAKSPKGQIFFSAKCIRAATYTCINVATDEVENYMDEGTCDGKMRLTRRIERQISELCEDEVKMLATSP